MFHIDIHVDKTHRIMSYTCKHEYQVFMYTIENSRPIFCMSTVMSDRNLSGLSGTTRKDPRTTRKYREVAIADLFV